MVKNNYLFIILCLLLYCLTGCNQTEFYSDTKNVFCQKSFKAIVENTHSRGILNDEGTFYWIKTDTMSVFGDESENIPFTASEEFNVEMNFSGDLNNLNENVRYAIYPYNENLSLIDGTLNFKLNEQRDFANFQRPPMIGLPQSKGTMSFYHMGGAIVLNFVDLKREHNKIIIRAEGENSPFLSGTAIVDDVNQPLCEYYITEGSKQVVYHLSNLDETQVIHTLYVPLQTGTYDKLSVVIQTLDGQIVQEKSISDLKVERKSYTILPTINISNTVYIAELPTEITENSTFNECYITSNRLFVGCKTNEGKTQSVTVAQLGSSLTNIDESNVAIFHYDSLEQISNVIINDLTVFFENYKDNKVDVSIAIKNDAVHLPSMELPSRISRAGVEGGIANIISNIFGTISFLTGLQSIPDAILSALGFVPDALANAAENENVTVVKASLQTTAAIILFGIAAAAGLTGTTGIIVTVGFFATILSILFELVSLFENRMVGKIYSFFCGNLSVTTHKMKKIDEDSYKAGYTINNINTVPSHPILQHLKMNPNPRSGLVISTRSIRNIIPPFLNFYFNNGELIQNVYGGELVKEGEFNYKRGYRYYSRAFISLFDAKTYPVTYYADTESITFDNAKINAISVSKGNFENGKYNFKVRAYATCQDASASYTMCLTKNDEIIETRTWGKRDNDVDFNVSLSLNDMNLKTLSAKDKWSIKILSNNDCTDEYIDEKDFDLKYKVPKSLSILSWKVTDTRENNSSRALNDNNDEKTYESDVEVTISYNGGGWFNDICIATSDGDRWSTTETISSDNGTLKVKGTLKYSETKSPASLSCYGILKDGETKYNGYGYINFPIVPIPVKQ